MRITTILVSLAMLWTAAVAPAQDEIAEGRELFEAGDFDGAAAKFKAALHADEKSFEARFGLARAEFGAGRYESAQFHAVKAERLKPDDLAAIELTGKAFKAIGEAKLARTEDPSGAFAEAIVSFENLAGRQPKDARWQGELGYLYYSSNRAEDSGAAYGKAASLDRKNAEYAHLGARSYAAAGKLEEALRLAKTAIARDRKVARYHMMRGQILGRMQKLEEAGAAFGEVLVARDSTPEERNTAATSMWNCYSPSQSWKPFSESLAAWTKRDRKNHFAWWWRGYVQLQAGDFNGAYKSYGKANEVSGGWAEALFYQGMARKSAGKEDDALELFKKAGSMPYEWAKDFGPAFQMQVMMGEAYGKPDYKRAVEIAEDYCLPVVSGPLKVTILSNLALFHRDWGGQAHSDDARDYYLEAIELAEKTEGMDQKFMAQLYNDTAIVYQYGRRHFYKKPDGLDRAIKYLKKSLACDETNSDACLNYGIILRDKGLLKEALEVIKKGVPRQDLNALRRQVESQLGQ